MKDILKKPRRNKPNTTVANTSPSPQSPPTAVKNIIKESKKIVKDVEKLKTKETNQPGFMEYIARTVKATTMAAGVLTLLVSILAIIETYTAAELIPTDKQQELEIQEKYLKNLIKDIKNINWCELERHEK